MSENSNPYRYVEVISRAGVQEEINKLRAARDEAHAAAQRALDAVGLLDARIVGLIQAREEVQAVVVGGQTFLIDVVDLEIANVITDDNGTPVPNPQTEFTF